MAVVMEESKIFTLLHYLHERRDRDVKFEEIEDALKDELYPVTVHSALEVFTERFYVELHVMFVVIHCYRIHDNGIRAYERLKAVREKERERKETEEQIQKLTKETLKNEVADYPKTQRRANLGLILSVIAIGVAILAIVAEYCKDDTVQAQSPLPIDTAKYRTFFEETAARLQSDSLSFGKITSYVDSLQRRIDSLEVHK